MLDVVLLGFFGLMLALGLRRPFIWVMTYIYVDIVAPQMVGWTLIQKVPMSLICFVVMFGGWLLLDDKKNSRFTLRQGQILALLAYCAVSTYFAQYHADAMTKWAWVWKALVFAAFLPLTLRTRLRLEAAVLTMVLSLAAIVIDGGIKTVTGGGGYGTLVLLVRDNSGLYEGSILSTAAVSTIPLILWLTRHGTIFKPGWKVWTFAAALIFATLLIPVGTAARTGLVCIAFLAALMLRSVRHRFLYAGMAGVALLAAMPFLPHSFLNRMGTIETYQSDTSASTRLAVWEWTMQYAMKHPLGGGFDAYMANSFTYKTRDVIDLGGGNVKIDYHTVTDSERAYHSSYFEMLGEQGFPGLALWLWLQALGAWQMERIRWRFARKDRDGEVDGPGKDSWQWGLATALQQAQLTFLVGSLFVGIAFQPYLFMLIGLQCGLWSYTRRTEDWSVRRKARVPDAVKPGDEALA